MDKSNEVLALADTVIASIKGYVASQMHAIRQRLETFGQRIDATEERLLQLGKRDPVMSKGDVGPAGPQGPQGERGDKPAHRWEGTALAFENPDGSFDDPPIELRGPKGEPGVTQIIAAPGIGIASPASAYFPQGW